MKKILIIITVIVATSNLFAQNSVVKLHLLQLAYGELRLGYEFVTNEHQSLVINAGLLIPREVPFGLYDESNIESYGGAVEILNKVSGISFSGEYRFYTGKKESPRGFYVAPYLKYNRYSLKTSTTVNYSLANQEFIDLDPIYKDAATGLLGSYNIDVTGSIKGTFRQFGVGAQLGYQWLIKDRVSIDFYFFGIGVESDAIVVEIKSETIPVDYTKWAEEIKPEVEDFVSTIGVDADVTVKSDAVQVKVPFVLPSLRGGLSIGFAF